MTIRAASALAAAIALLAPVAAPASGPATAAPRPIEVMVVGTFHFANPGLDYRNVKVDDVLAPARQREIEAVVAALARFRPTLVGLEGRDAPTLADYARYRAGTLAPSRDESVQLGFRLARRTGAAVRGMDTPMSLPFDPALAYAAAHGQQAFIDRVTAVSDANVAAQESTLKTRGIAATLRLLNDPAAAMSVHGLYRQMLAVGGGAEQPGLDATATWYRRNLAICANLLQAARPGDRVVVMFGAGHLTLLRQCIEETPGYVLVDARRYLPR